jgi:cob(I)alamin adenosyltransferase
MTEEFKIYTRTGDKGQTALIGGTRVPKYHDRIEAYGTVDELNSFVGLIRDHEGTDEQSRKTLLEIQDRLFTLESHLAEDKEAFIPKPMPSLFEADVELLETEIDRMNKDLHELTNFILPGGHMVVSYCHVARTICRRAERLAVRLSEHYPVDALDLQYLNRLSDYFFVLARYLGHHNGAKETVWNARY